jgi:hypothetical protein
MTSTREVARGGKQALQQSGRETRQRASTGTGWYAVVARAGLVAKGVSFGIVGILAAELALGGSGNATDRGGALEAVSEHWYGKVLLILLAFGFAAYAIWQFVAAFADRRETDDATGEAKTWGRRAGYVGGGLIYAGLTFVTITILTGSGAQQSQNETARETTATAFDLPGGRWLIGIAGMSIVGAALWNAYSGLSKRFEQKWKVAAMNAAERKWGGRAGRAGHLARAVVFGLIGIFLVKAAIDFEARESIGLDGALQKLAQQTYGPWLLGLTAAGLIAYALFCLVEARYRDVSTSTS